MEILLEDLDGNRDSIKAIKVAAKQNALKQLESKWENKPLHGQYTKRINKADVDKSATFAWLKSSGLKGETEGLIMAAQDQSLPTKAQQARVYKCTNDPKCWLCTEYDETIDHLVSGCPMLARTEYTHRHDKVGKYIHWKICQHFQIPTDDLWYKHQPQPVTEQDQVKILWDFPIITDKEIKANRPDIVLINNSDKTCLLIDMTVPSDNNISLKEYEKLAKYKDLEIEIQKMWKVKTTVVPVVLGALGAIHVGLKNHISKIPGDIAPEQLQKIALLGTAHILRKSLSLK